MKLETTARQLQSAFRLLGRAVEKRNTMPILGCVHIEGGRLRTTNLDQELSCSVAATEARGTACIDFYRLRGLVSLIPGGEVVRITAGKDGAEIRFPGGRYDLPVAAPDDFPLLAKPDAHVFETTSLAGSGFKDAVEFVRHSISREETRYYLNGFCISRGADGAPCLVATDGHRMSVAPISAAAGWMDGKIVPREAVAVLAAMPEPDDVAYIAGERVRFTWPGASLTTKLIEGSFPDWKRVQPKLDDGSVGVTVERRALDAALARAQVIGGKKAIVSLGFFDDAAAITLKRQDFGTVREFLPSAVATNAAKGAAIGFDASYMRTLLGLMREPNVRLAFSDRNGPMKLNAAGFKPWSILMPARAYDPEFALEVLRESAPAQIGRAA